MLSRAKPDGQVALVALVKHYLKNATMSSTLAQRIKILRKKLGLTQEAFGAELGVSKAAVSQWESDKEDQRTKPTVENLRAIAELAHTTLGWLLEESGPKEAAPSPREEDQLTPLTLAEALAAALAASNAARRLVSADVIRRLAEDPENADLIRALADMLTADDVAAEREFEHENPERPRRLPKPSAGGNVNQAPANDPKKRGAA
jgi:transcriptional regulator with XRE-family HTH domain